MPSVYKRKLGSRRYADYPPARLRQCLDAIREGTSHRVASITYNIPRKTIYNKLKKKHLGKPGFPSIFSNDEERSFVRCIHSLSNFGFPVNELEFRYIVQSYLNKIGRRVPRFKNNLPGKDWIKLFIRRHEDLTVRLSTNIKRARAALDEETLRTYIDNLSTTLDGVSPQCIYNYDESNLTDDPGLKKILTKRGIKYPERICNSSKSSISIMMAGNAAGELLPPYVVYKSSRLWDTWTENGPEGTRYNNTPSGWFESATFSDWFKTVMLPVLKKKEGKKVVIGDNLSSHINMEVIQLCEDNNISFVCLPPNSTHVTQPLDVAFFAPMKKTWRQILSDYKESHSGGRATVLEKQVFPRLLKLLMERLRDNAAANLKAGFKKCGIFPCDVSPLLERIKATTSTENAEIEKSFIDYFEKKKVQATELKVKRKKKINIDAGKSIVGQNKENVPLILEEERKSDGDEDNQRMILESDEDNPEDFMEAEIREAEEDIQFDKKLKLGLLGESNRELDKNNLRSVERKFGEFVVVRYENELYPGKITVIKEDEVLISAMEKAKKYWKWPEKKDEIWYNWIDVLGAIDPPVQVTKRGFFKFPQLDKFWWE